MSTDIVVPTLGESITEATVAKWYKKPGDAVAQDEPLVELETDKVAVEVNAPAAGVLGEIQVAEGDTVQVGAVIGSIGASEGKPAAKAEAKPESKPAPKAEAKPAPAAKAPAEPAPSAMPEPPAEEHDPEMRAREAVSMAPAAARLVEESKLDPNAIEGTGRGGRITKGDVLKALETPKAAPAAQAPAAQPAKPAAPPREPGEREERVQMSRLRRTIAARLKEAQNTAAMLTTFNELDMTALIQVRNQYRDLFEKKHGVRLGFMSFFAKACVMALKEIPSVNAEVDGDSIIYKNHYDVGVAVSAPQGLVVPVIRDVDEKSLAGIEKAIGEAAVKARDGKLALADLQGGTFTISNGGVFGSLMSTPILNPPQSGILGMHKVQDRPVVVDGQIVVRPMMYLALSYDHRIVDGREAVTFLVRVKECLEDPHRLLLDL
ncbi:2-oxoglutarate dehydrogenase complex dihydrolipoyllysine-residue succinyltransferase [Iodidimonas sp. SYSU 1G8]|uniref:2-oxoglutarate dehydrogenase complex dihydrolipoyllysine-residue succinyltransferase n=1 Tax=Iodidimonas sp. SYSU 1G8 TaxID=3133967 RepID=UPI0031FE9062